MTNQMLMKIEGLIEGTVIKRPSKYIKSPYVADVDLEGKEILLHTASLGCGGLVDVGATILMAPMPIPKSKNNKQKCSYRVYLSLLREKGNKIIVGIHPKLAEDLAESALQKNCLSILQNIKKYRRETTIFVENKVDSRFDFSGIDENNVPFIMEVKNVPLADYEDISAKDKKKIPTSCYDNRLYNSKVAYFPDGYRKKSTDTVSPRALKHICELTLIKKESITRCIMCFVIQRNDVDRFQPSIIDPEYRQAVKKAIESGVEIITLVVEWNTNGEAYFIRDDLPIN